MQRGHLTDDRLIEVALAPSATTAEDAHCARCDACAARRAEIERLLRDVGDAASAEADAVFPADRLAAQHARILQRIEQDGRPARVIAFPAGQSSEIRPLRTRPAARWIAAAAAAGLAVGVLAGHLAHDLPTFGRPSRTPAVSTAAARPTSRQPVLRAVVLNDEQLLDEIDHAIEGPSLAVLRPLNDLTPQ
jgi:anti-sigma factor RsiW